MLRVLLFVSLAAAGVLSTTSSVHVDLEVEQFMDFEAKFEKVYTSSEERNHRLAVFRQNLRDNRAHNSRPNVSYKKGINQFSDLTAEEFRRHHLGGYVRTSKGQGSAALMHQQQLSESAATSGRINEWGDLPKNVDWRDKGIITPLKNQGGCGSCWAFCTVENVESYIALATGNLTTLSTQELVSCMPNTLECGGTGGCFGGTCELAYNWIQAFGLVSDSVIPYESGTTGETGECTLDVDNMERIGFVRGYETLVRNDMQATMEHLANVGPLSIALDASKFHQYENGVFDDCDYNENIEINHGVQLIGYGSNDFDGAYWIIRNSWGESFGEAGIIRLRMEMGQETQCGLDSTPAMGVKCKGDGFAVDKVCGQCGLLFTPSYPIGADTSAHISP